MMESNNLPTYTVSDALLLAKEILTNISIVVEGEICNLKKTNSYSAIYFSLKDEKSYMNCLIWKSNYYNLGFDLQEGQKVRIKGIFSVYLAKGNMSFDAKTIELVGEGDLRLKVARIASKLEKEGLFDESSKKELPIYPSKIAIVTSGNGAVIHDCIRTIKRRACDVDILFFGIRIEGKDAICSIKNGLVEAASCMPDVILLVRGGGSYEDLMPFNDEDLCRLIASIQIPIVTGIGHEPDNCIADMVADFRASTPTAASEIVTANIFNLINSLTNYKLRVDNASPIKILEDMKIKVDKLVERIIDSKDLTINRFNSNLSNYATRIEDLSPLSAFKRGYSCVLDKNKNVIRKVEGISTDDEVDVVIEDGIINAKVIDFRKMKLEEVFK